MMEKIGEGGHTMRKFFSRNFYLGLIVGLLLAGAVPAYGAVASLVGRTVEGEYSVKVDGAELAAKSIAIDGTTYAPLRSIGEAIGYEVAFEDKIVRFIKKPISGGDQVNSNEPVVNQSEFSLFEIENGIAEAENGIRIWSNFVKGFDNAGIENAESENARAQLNDYEAKLKLWQDRKAEYEANHP